MPCPVKWGVRRRHLLGPLELKLSGAPLASTLPKTWRCPSLPSSCSDTCRDRPVWSLAWTFQDTRDHAEGVDTDRRKSWNRELQIQSLKEGWSPEDKAFLAWIDRENSFKEWARVRYFDTGDYASWTEKNPLSYGWLIVLCLLSNLSLYLPKELFLSSFKNEMKNSTINLIYLDARFTLEGQEGLGWRENIDPVFL